MTHSQTEHAPGHGKRLSLLGLSILVGAIAVTWAWNHLVGAPFALEQARYVDGVAALSGLAAAGATWRLAQRLVTA